MGLFGRGLFEGTLYPVEEENNVETSLKINRV
jgi:hypothetical protein